MSAVLARDEMTGLLTRRAFYQVVEEAVKKEKLFSVAVLDVNDFITINRTLGPDGGDRVLVYLGGFLAQTATAAGWQVGRTGGDEFALLIPRLSLEQTFLRMEELRKEIAGTDFFAGLGDMGPLRSFGVSIGVANYPRDARDTDTLMRTADEALYSAKENGKNCVGLPANQEMVLKSCHYTATQLRRLKMLAEKLGEKESKLLREALDDLLNKHDVVLNR